MYFIVFIFGKKYDEIILVFSPYIKHVKNLLFVNIGCNNETK